MEEDLPDMVLVELLIRTVVEAMVTTSFQLVELGGDILTGIALQVTKRARTDSVFPKRRMRAMQLKFLKCWITSLLLTACASTPPPSLPGVPIANFRKVDSGIYRGGQPDQNGYQYLQSIGVKTVLKLNADAAIAEPFWAGNAGINLVEVSLSAFLAPSSSDINKALAVLKDPKQQPVFVHCEHGEDRTGLVVGIYRIEVDHWTPKVAHDEMLVDGFHEELIGLQMYFWEREEK